MKNLIVNLFFSLSLFVMSVGIVNAQNTCSTAQLFDDYTYNGQQMMATFSTVGVPNDNSTANPTFCSTSVGTGGQKWFRMSLPNTAPIQVTLSTDHAVTNFDTKIHVYTGSCGSLTCVAGDDDSGTGTTSLVTFTAQPNTTYRIRVGGFNAAEGTTYVTMTAGTPGCTDPTAQNYIWTATWDNGSCCYDAYAVFSLSNGSGQSPLNNASIIAEETNWLTIHPGTAMSACLPATCELMLLFYDYSLPTWQGTTYSLWVNGAYFTGIVPDPDYDGFSRVFISLCGCTDPIAGNYSTNALYDDGSCCYNGSITLSADAPAGNQIYFYSGNLWFPMAIANAGQTTTFCAPDVCNSKIRLVRPTGVAPGGTYTVNLYGQTITGTVTADVEYITITTDECGCTDPTALNYDPDATLDNNKCYFDENVFCESAELLYPYFITTVSTEDVPTGLGVPSGCDWINGLSKVLWYKFIYNGGAVRITTMGTMDTQLGVFDQCEGNLIYCAEDNFIYGDSGDNNYFSLNPVIHLSCQSNLVKGQTYYIAVATYPTPGTFSLYYETTDFPGCTDPAALNYSNCASVDDESCVYPDNCPADFDNNGSVNVGDLLVFISFYGSDCGATDSGN